MLIIIQWQTVVKSPTCIPQNGYGGSLMNIRNFTSYFHDGGVIDIQRTDNTIEFSLMSAEIWDESFIGINLSEDHRIKGKLHLKGVQSIKIDDIDFNGILSKQHDSGSIFDFSIEDHTVSLTVIWSNYPPKERVQTDLFCYKIIAKQIDWENLPDMVIPN